MATLDQLKDQYLAAKEKYYNDKNGKNLMSDAMFDKLEDKIRKADPKWKGFKAGAPVNKKTKVKLPVPMFSLDKLKAPTVQAWLDSQNPNDEVTLSDKLDGSSLEIVYTKGRPTFCATRGNGVIGGEVSFLIPHLRIPQKVGTSDFTIRCEGLFSKAGFLKYKAEFDAARNAASGILNRQDVHHSMKDLKVVVLQVMKPNVQPSKGLRWAKQKGFIVVPFKVFKIRELNAHNLSTLLAQRKVASKFDMDGLVLTLDKVNKLPMNGNPDWAKAFKENIDADSATVTTVRKVVWEISSHGLIKPVVIYDPVNWDGAKLVKATAFNAAFVNANGIGVGAKIAILRSGEIIPYIAKVLKKVKPSVPDPKVFGEYHLTKNDTDYVLSAPLENEDFRVKKIARFFANLEVDYLREQTVRKMYEVGFDNVKSITRATVKDFMGIPGIQAKGANKLYEAIHSKIDQGVPVVKLMDASGVFPSGMGETRFETIAKYHDLLDLCALPESEQLAILLKIPGFKDLTADFFIRGSKKFLKWVKLVGITPVKPKKVKVKLDSQKLAGMGISWTGYRSDEQESTVKANGGTVESFGGRTKTLLVSPTGKASSKAQKAEQKGIPVMTWEAFARKYKL